VAAERGRWMRISGIVSDSTVSVMTCSRVLDQSDNADYDHYADDVHMSSSGHDASSLPGDDGGELSGRQRQIEVPNPCEQIPSCAVLLQRGIDWADSRQCPTTSAPKLPS